MKYTRTKYAKTAGRGIAALAVLLLAASAHSQNAGNAPQDAASQETPNQAEEPLPTVDLEELLALVTASTNREFLIHRLSRRDIYIGGIEPEEVTYPMLLSVLRSNDLAAVEIEGRTNIMPLPGVRSYPVPMVQQDDADIPDDEWVTRIIEVNNIESAHLVPILRPLLPQAAHLAALPPQKLLIVDTYSNVRRITELVNALDR